MVACTLFSLPPAKFVVKVILFGRARRVRARILGPGGRGSRRAALGVARREPRPPGPRNHSRTPLILRRPPARGKLTVCPWIRATPRLLHGRGHRPGGWLAGGPELAPQEFPA